MATLSRQAITAGGMGEGSHRIAAARRACAILLVASCWLSAAIFGAYILAFFGGVAASGAAERWNESLPGLHDDASLFATRAIGLHFVAGGILLLLGPIQLLAPVRAAVPGLHRWLGRLYVLSAGLAGAGGLGYILAKGTIGGSVMSTGFALYGALMVLASLLAYLHARQGRYARHRAWAIRLYALTVGSWLYRIEYGFWFLAAGRLGHRSDFHGWFDAAMAFFFFLPNLAVAELFIRARGRTASPSVQAATAGVLLAASAFVLVATWSFTVSFWGPGIVSGVTGRPL